MTIPDTAHLGDGGHVQDHNDMATTLTSHAASIVDHESRLDNQGLFNVRDYLAVGDGTTDDSTAIQAAITAADAVGGVVYFPPGEYKVSTTLTVTDCSLMGAPFRSNRTVPSSTNGSIIKAATGQDFAAIKLARSSRGIVIDGLVMDLSGQTNGSSSTVFTRSQTKGIHVDGAWNWTIRNVHLVFTPSNASAIYVDDGSPSLGSFWGIMENVLIESYTKFGIAHSYTGPGDVASPPLGARDQTAKGIVMNGATTSVTAVSLRDVTNYRGMHLKNVEQLVANNYHAERSPSHGVYIDGGSFFQFVGGFYEYSGNEDPAGVASSYLPFYGTNSPRMVQLRGCSLVGNGITYSQWGDGFTLEGGPYAEAAEDNYKRYGALIIDRAGQGRFTGATDVRIRGFYSAATALSVGSDTTIIGDEAADVTWDALGLHSTGSGNFGVRQDATEGFTGKLTVTYTLYVRKTVGTFAADDWVDIKLIFSNGKYPSGASAGTDWVDRHYAPAGNTFLKMSGTFEVSLAASFNGSFNLKADTNVGNVVPGLANTNAGRGFISYRVIP